MSLQSLVPVSGPHGFCSIVPADGVINVSGSKPEVIRVFEAIGENTWPDARLSLSGVSQGFDLTMGWEGTGTAQVLLRTLTAWAGLGFRVGSYPGTVILPDTSVVRVSGTLSDGASLNVGLGDPDLTGRIFHLKADLAWSASLIIGASVPMEDALQDWGVVALPCAIDFAVAISSGWRDESGDPFSPFMGGYNVPVGGFAGHSFRTDPELVPVVFERGWSTHYPGHFLQGFRGSRF